MGRFRLLYRPADATPPSAPADATPPSAPVISMPHIESRLIVIGLVTPSTDDVGVVEYIICRTSNGAAVTKSDVRFAGLEENDFPGIDGPLTNGVLYKYAVFAKDAAGKESELSNEVSGTPQPN